MTKAGSTCRWASRMVTRRISWTDQRTSAGPVRLSGFFGGCLIGAAPDGRQYGKREHDERDVSVPAVPASRLVVIEPEFVLRCLKCILDRPARAFHPDQRPDICAVRTPGREEGKLLIDG